MSAADTHRLRQWNREYGVDPVFIGHNSLELQVEKRELRVDALKRLVREQVAFDPDLTQADDWVITALENVLGHKWTFWFD